MTMAAFRNINEGKVNFDEFYAKDDPRDYFKFLGRLDYIIPHLAQPIFDQIIRARAAQQDDPVTVLDLGSSYGVNGALMKYALDYDALRLRYTAPAFQSMSSDKLLELDRHFYRAWPKHEHLRVIGLDISDKAVRYAQACGAVDVGLAMDLETCDPRPQEEAIFEDVDLIVSTGCVGYISSKTFERLARVTTRRRPTWVVSFVIRLFPFDDIAETLARQGLVTEKLEGTTFVQRRFASIEEMEAAIRTVEGRGLDTRGHEAEGLYHAELYVSRPAEEVERNPLNKLVTVVSGANKPWTVGTNVLATFGDAARRRARRKHLTLAQPTKAS
ncbi:MAG TPA: class I SAM-dependent methyltransferase [Xanthobacteraceae bacterium]|nr:class I SAM-dependent methyltransferase [Xanthobacteraceae bacterium]